MPGPTLVLSPLTAEAFAAFGDVIATEGKAHFPINSGMVQRFHDLALVDVLEAGGKPGISLFVAQPYPMPLALAYLERHPLSSQAFVPLDGRPYIVVVAAADALPGRDTLRAFLARGDQGVNYHRGVWHHVLVAVGQVSTFAVIDRIGTGPNCDRFELDPAELFQVDLPA